MPGRPTAVRAGPAHHAAGGDQRPAVAAAAAHLGAAAAPHATARHVDARSPAPRSAPPKPATAQRRCPAAGPTTTIPPYQALYHRPQARPALSRSGAVAFSHGWASCDADLRLRPVMNARPYSTPAMISRNW